MVAPLVRLSPVVNWSIIQVKEDVLGLPNLSPAFGRREGIHNYNEIGLLVFSAVEALKEESDKHIHTLTNSAPLFFWLRAFSNHRSHFTLLCTG